MKNEYPRMLYLNGQRRAKRRIVESVNQEMAAEQDGYRRLAALEVPKPSDSDEARAPKVVVRAKKAK